MKLFFNIGYNLQSAIFIELSSKDLDVYDGHLTKIATFNKPFKIQEGFPPKKLPECLEYFKKMKKL
jgi:hypothetical protein